MGVMQHAPTDAEDQRPMPPHEGCEGRLVAAVSETLEQMLAGGGTGSVRRNEVAQVTQDSARVCRGHGCLAAGPRVCSPYYTVPRPQTGQQFISIHSRSFGVVPGGGGWGRQGR